MKETAFWSERRVPNTVLQENPARGFDPNDAIWAGTKS
jgi:hypothetical protein